MKAGWVTTPIEELARTSAGGTPAKSQKHFYEGGTIPWLLSGEVGQRDITVAQNFITEAGLKGSSAKVFPANSVLVAMYGATAGEVGILRFEAATNQAVCAVLPNQRYVPEYLYYFMLLAKERLVAQAVGNAQPNISQAKIRALPIPLPPLDEQKRIVAVLDEAFEGLSRARANAESNVADAQVLALNHLRNLFVECARLHPMRRIGDIAEHCLGKMLDKNKNQGTLRPYLRNINVRWFEVDTSDMLEMRIEDREVERYSAKKGDLLICEGGYPGRAAVWNKDEPVFFQKALHRVRFSNPDYATFLMYFLFMKDATGQLKENFTGSGIQHFTGQALAQFQMPFPDLGTVVKTVSQIEEVNATTSALERHYQATIAELDTLRQSLLQKAFSGDLT